VLVPSQEVLNINALETVYSKAIPFLSEAFIGSSQKKDLELFLKSLAFPCRVDSLILESPLASNKRWLDLSFFLPLNHEQITLLSEYCSENLSTEKIWKKNTCRALLNLLTQGKERDLFTKYAMKGLWFEFDHGSAKSSAGDPNLFIALNNCLHFREALTFLHQMIREKEIEEKILKKVLECADLCHESGWKIAYLAFMLPRSQEGLRICLLGENFQPDQIRVFLQKLGYQNGSLSSVFWKKLSLFTKEFLLSIDLGEKIEPRLGVDCYLDNTLQYSERAKRWEEFFSFLISEKFTSEEKKQAALSWIGGHKEGCFNNQIAERCGVDPTSVTYNTYIRNINYIKFIFSNTASIDAKVYLNVLHYVEPVAKVFA
jgi:hypothetical protein